MYSHKIGTLLVLSVFVTGFQNCSGVKFDPAAGSQNSNSLSSSRDVSQNIEGKAQKKVDVLFIVDNSGSMAQEQINMSAKVDGFLQLIQNLDWQIALTTTDGNANTKDSAGVSRPWGDGQFRPFDSDTGSQYILKGGTESLAAAQAKLKNAIMVGLAGGGREVGISTTYRAVERMSSSTVNKSFFRTDSVLFVVLISDEDECSNASCLTTDARSVPSNLLQFVRTKFGSSKVFTYNAFVVQQADASCSQGTVGATHSLMAHISGGIVSSICASDYTAQLAVLGNYVTELVNSVNLECVPSGNVEVYLNGTSKMAPAGYSLKGTLLSFSSALPVGKHVVKYNCSGA